MMTDPEVVTRDHDQRLARIESNALHFVKGELAWSGRKKKIILDMGADFKYLIDNHVKVEDARTYTTIDYGAYVQENIASLVCHKLEQYDASPISFSYVRKLFAPKGWTDVTAYELASAAARSLDYDESIQEAGNVDLLKMDYIPRAVFAKLPKADKIRYKKEYRERSKERKFRDRENNSMMDDELLKDGIDPRLLKSGHQAVDTPSPEFWRETLSSKELKRTEGLVNRLSEIFSDLQVTMVQFPPDPVLDKRIAEALKVWNDNFWSLLVRFYSPNSDYKNADTLVGWFDRLLSDYFALDDPQIARKALLTGEFVMLEKDGTEMIIPTTRKVTNKHTKEKLAALELEMRKLPLFGLMFFGMELYLNNAGIYSGGDQEQIAKVREAFKKAQRSTYKSFGREEPTEAAEITISRPTIDVKN